MEVLSMSSLKTLPNQWCGVPERKRGVVSCRATTVANSNTNLYKVLSLSPKSATMDDIKRAYRSMALRYHPDVCHDPSKKDESTRLFVQLNQAYETLSNPTLKQEYDHQLGLITAHDESSRKRWKEQLAELKTRSHRKQGSWGSRMRAQNIIIMMNNHN
ncbi:chaperone protein dnaJ 20, chloroplastic-like [Arachis stenosperma]|uniref:chaperone protein dnaJ 20, chloroplastic-like n=1 Tax=Arachis stenosperma TaxID=217475 RepID=UPI0025AC200F|nr:chaperone protein dnaJ 20, chloroplastic-like [Arachis stenosperma]